MERCSRIYEHPIYKRNMARIAEAERDRKFCLHDLTHALDVARIGRIMILEEELDIDTELFYAAALLHDAGRYTGIPHNRSGAALARELMPLCGFDSEETELAANAIAEHRIDENSSDFSRILYTADKRSRLCFCCAASGDCYWPEEKKNHGIDI